MLTMFENFLVPLLKMSLVAAFVAAIVILLRFILKKRAPKQVVCLLWLLVFARLLIPVAIESPVSLVPSILDEVVPGQVAQEESPAVPDTNSTAPGFAGEISEVPAATYTPVLEDVSVLEVPPVAETPAETTPDKNAAPVWTYAIPAVWLAGVAVMLLIAVGSYVKLRRRVYDSIRTEDGVWEHPSLASPFILGLFRPRIYLPMGISGAPRQFILQHEHAHLRRLDHVVKPICWLALALHWFNPLAWVAFMLMSRDIETACDESVLRKLGSEVKADYSATLLALATDKRFPAPSPLSFGEGDAKVRIKNVLSFKKPALWVSIAAVVVVIVAAVCLLTDPEGEFDPKDYITYDYYPGLYFQEETDQRYGHVTAKAYKLVDGELELVAGYTFLPANNFDIIIHPDGTETQNWGALSDTLAIYEQYLVDACLEADENWVETHLEPKYTVKPSPYPSTVIALGVYYTPGGNLLIQKVDQVRVLPLPATLTESKLFNISFADVDGDTQDELLLLWDDAVEHYTIAEPQTLLYVGDYLMVCEWDGENWTAYNANESIARSDTRLTFSAGSGIVEVFSEHDLLDTITFHIPEELGSVQTLAVSGTGQITLDTAGACTVTRTVYAIPEGGSVADGVPLFCLSGPLTYHGEKDAFSVEFQTISDILVSGEGAEISPAELGELLYEDELIALYAINKGWDTVLTYGAYTQVLSGFSYNWFRPGCTTWEADADSDGTKELYIIHQTGSGTGAAVDTLVVCEPDGEKLNVWYHDITDIQTEFNENRTAVYDPESQSVSITYGGQTYTVELGDDDSYEMYMPLVTELAFINGCQVSYAPIGGGSVLLTFALSISGDGVPMMFYLPAEATVSCLLRFTGDGFEVTDKLRFERELPDEPDVPPEDGPPSSLGFLGSLPLGIVTSDTLPSDPEDYYLVAELPESYVWLYARNHGQESMLRWDGNFWWPLEGRVAHTGHMNLPKMCLLEETSSTTTVAVVSEVNTGTQVGVDELAVYVIGERMVQSSSYNGMQDYVYDWQTIAAQFNRDNTLIYDKETNSFTLTYGGNNETYATGTLAEDMSTWLGLEDGFTGAAIATGQIVRYRINEDKTITVTMQTCVGRGSQGEFDEDGFWRWADEDNRYYPLSVGVTGIELSWNIKFQDGKFYVYPFSIGCPGLEVISQ